MAQTAGHIEIKDFAQWFPSGDTGRWAAREISLEVPCGQFLAIVGPSGCGKSTVLNAVAGLRSPSHGDVYVDGQVVSGVNRDVGYLFQRDALLPWRTVLDNVMLPLKYRGVRNQEAKDRAREWLHRVKLAGYEDHYPHQLSGGMRKRVSLATVFVYRPSVLLMDEPFSALDVQTRNLMETELLGLWEQAGPTVLFVTHDLEEAIGLSDRVVVMTSSPGTVKSVYPVDLERPREVSEIRFQAEFQSIYASIWEDLREEVMVAYEESTIGSDAQLA